MIKKQFALVVLAILGIAYFALFLVGTEMFKPKVQKTLESFFLRPVRFSRVSIGWNYGLSLKLDQIVFYPKQGVTNPAIFSARQCDIRLDLLGPLMKQPLFRSVRILDPGLQINRRQDGSLWLGLTHSQNGIWYSDMSQAGDLHLIAAQGEMYLKDFSFDKPSEFKLNLALFNKTPNVFFNGEVLVSSKKQISFNWLKMETDLESWNAEKFAQTSPFLRRLELKRMSGRLEASFKPWFVYPSRIAESSATIRIRKLSGKFELLNSPIEIPMLEAVLDGAGRFEIKPFRAKFGNGTFAANVGGSLKEPVSATSLKMKADDLDLDDFGRAFSDNLSKLKGRLSMTFSGSFMSFNADRMLSTFTGQGSVVLRDGLILDFNLLSELFSVLSISPESSAQEFTENLQQKLRNPETPLGVVACSFSTAGGEVLLDSIQIFSQDSDWNFQANGVVDIDRELNIESSIHLNPPFSYEASQAIPELQHLMNEEGFIQIPVKIEGPFGSVRVIPDTAALASGMIASTGQGNLTSLIQKKLQDNPSIANQLTENLSAASGFLSESQIEALKKILAK